MCSLSLRERQRIDSSFHSDLDTWCSRTWVSRNRLSGFSFFGFQQQPPFVLPGMVAELAVQPRRERQVAKRLDHLLSRCPVPPRAEGPTLLVPCLRHDVLDFEIGGVRVASQLRLDGFEHHPSQLATFSLLHGLRFDCTLNLFIFRPVTPQTQDKDGFMTISGAALDFVPELSEARVVSRVAPRQAYSDEPARDRPDALFAFCPHFFIEPTGRRPDDSRPKGRQSGKAVRNCSAHGAFPISAS